MEAYDVFADFYNRAWGQDYHLQITHVLDRLVLSHLHPGDSILDIGCGTGQVASQLIARGFRATGIDQSGQMVAFALRNAPEGQFFQADACNFALKITQDAAIATFEAMNHILDPADLARSFACTAPAVNHLFVFDMLGEGAYELL